MVLSDSTQAFRLTTSRTDDHTILNLAGELDVIAASALIRTLPRPQDCAQQIVLDASAVTFCATAAVRIVLMFHDRVRGCGGELVLRHPSRATLRALEAVGELDRVRIQAAPPPAQPRNPDTAYFRRMLDTAMRAADAPMGYARAAQPSTGPFQVIARRGVSRLLPSFFETMHHGEPAGPLTAEHLPAVYVEDVLNPPVPYGPGQLNALYQSGVRATAAVPVIAHGGALLGQLCLLRRTRTAWSPDQRRTLEDIARRAPAGTVQTREPAHEKGVQCRSTPTILAPRRSTSN